MIKKSSFVIGVTLILVNISGLFIPLRNEQYFSELNSDFKPGRIISEKKLWDVIDSDNSNVIEYIKSLNAAVNNGIAHYWLDAGINKYNLRIPVYENYILYSLSWIYPEVFRKYEFKHYRKAIERGVGLCSQHVIILTEVLKEKGLSSKIIRLDGHVVATVLVDEIKNKWWVLDPDYGVIVQHDIGEIENNPAIVASSYYQAGYNKEQINILINIYDPKGNKIVNGVKEFDWQAKYWLLYYFESFSYLLKWLLPLLLLLPYANVISHSRKQKD